MSVRGKAPLLNNYEQEDPRTRMWGQKIKNASYWDTLIEMSTLHLTEWRLRCNERNIFARDVAQCRTFQKYFVPFVSYSWSNWLKDVLYQFEKISSLSSSACWIVYFVSVCFAIRNNKMSRRQRKRKICEKKKEKLNLFEGFLGNCGRLKVFFSQ